MSTNEATERNYALVERYGSLPSYCYFTPDDDLDDPEKCATWWTTWWSQKRPTISLHVTDTPPSVVNATPQLIWTQSEWWDVGRRVSLWRASKNKSK